MWATLQKPEHFPYCIKKEIQLLAFKLKLPIEFNCLLGLAKGEFEKTSRRTALPVYVNPHTSPVFLIVADCVLYIELRGIPRLVLVFEMIWVSNLYCDAHCTYTVSFHRGKWIDVKLQLLKFKPSFIQLFWPRLISVLIAFSAYKETKS